jgi:dCTP deaminase
MTVLADWQIRSYCEGSQMVWPFDLDLLNPASLDVRLGFNLMIEVEDTPELQRIDISDRTEENPYLLQPGEFCLAETIETFSLPDTISAQFVLKSSRARAGVNHLLAGWCDPGWHGSKLTLELKNERRFHDIPLYPNLKIGQMVFHYMSEIPVKSYRETGHYNNHLTVMPDIVGSQTA